jgi:UDP:flavonoid glycosyltransferase YjiC (YdhE family)
LRIGIQTWGSEGDIRPFIALGHGLVTRGHDVELIYTEIAERRYEAAAAALGIRARAVATPVIKTQSELYRLGLLAINARSPLIQAKIVIDHFFKPAENAIFDAAVELVDRSDLLIGHFFVHQLRAAAERAGKPEVSVTFAHTMVPSRHIHPVGLPRLGEWGDAIGWRLARVAMNWMWLAEINRFRRRVGVPPARDTMLDVWVSHLLNLVAVSPALCPTPPDWPASNRVSGFLALPPDPNETLAPAIEQFLAAGPPPVFMGFGSLMPTDSSHLTDTVVLLRDAARRAGCRAIIQAEVTPADYSADDVLIVSRAPHALLFPRCAAVVNHGGAGTTHTVARAGVPSVPVPHLSDQYAWADQLHHLGLAPAGLPRRALTSAKLARRIKAAVGNPDMRQRARELHMKMQDDDGVKTGARLVEESASWPRN